MSDTTTRSHPADALDREWTNLFDSYDIDGADHLDRDGVSRFVTACVRAVWSEAHLEGFEAGAEGGFAKAYDEGYHTAEEDYVEDFGPKDEMSERHDLLAELLNGASISDATAILSARKLTAWRCKS